MSAVSTAISSFLTYKLNLINPITSLIASAAELFWFLVVIGSLIKVNLSSKYTA